MLSSTRLAANRPERRKQLYYQVQEILGHELPYVNLWYYDNVLVHTRRSRD